ncbi:MAG: Ig-like domain-containing protein, partial [Tannerellaceae bacterium]|nr:Ig-like domain-containing protein [Tannerellaceae bacterium]
DGDWVGNYKSEYAYDAAGRQTMYAYYNWADGDWAIRERRTYDNEDPVYADNIYVTTITLTEYYGESVFESRGIGINIPRYGIYSPFTHSGAGDVVYDSEVDGAGCLTKLTAYCQTDGNRDELYSGEMEYRDGRLTDFTTTIAGEGHIRNKIVRQYNDAGQQTLNEIYYWNYETNSLEISGKQVYAYDDAGRQTLYEYYWWNYSTNRLEADYKQVYAYDEAGRQILYEYYYGDGIGLGWELSSRDVYAYNEAGQQTLYGYYSPHDDYGYKWEREYDADGYESSYANYYWDAAGSAWAGRNKEVYTERNEQNNIIITTLYSWNINRWEKSRYRIEYPDATQTAPVALKPVLFEVSSACEASYPLRLESLLPGISGFGALSYDILMVDDPDDIAGDIGYTDEELTIPIRQTASNGQEAFISVLITSENYSQFVVTVRVTATGKTWVNISATMEGGVYNGQPYEFDGPIVTTNLEGEPLTLGIAIAYETEGGSRSETPPVNAGNYKLILYPENEAGYAGSLSVDFSITQRPIQIAAEDKTVQTGGALPAFTYKVEGAIAGETAITGAPVLSSPTANLSVAATYPIVVDLTGVTPTGNYQFADNAAVAGTLTVTGTPPVAVNGVTLNVSEAALAVAETIQLIATVSPANADNKGITWQTSDDAVAAVAADGTVTALAPGTAVITVITNDGGYSAICTITVTDSSVGVEQIAQEPAVFFYESTLTVNSPASETITVYSFNGLRLFQAKKPQGKAVFTIANPAGQRFVIVTGSSGWTTKTAR